MPNDYPCPRPRPSKQVRISAATPASAALGERIAPQSYGPASCITACMPLHFHQWHSSSTLVRHAGHARVQSVLSLRLAAVQLGLVNTNELSRAGVCAVGGSVVFFGVVVASYSVGKLCAAFAVGWMCNKCVSYNEHRARRVNIP